MKTYWIRGYLVTNSFTVEGLWLLKKGTSVPFLINQMQLFQRFPSHWAQKKITGSKLRWSTILFISFCSTIEKYIDKPLICFLTKKQVVCYLIYFFFFEIFFLGEYWILTSAMLVISNTRLYIVTNEVSYKNLLMLGFMKTICIKKYNC